MKFKKFICGILGASILLSTTAVFASFPDVDGDKTVAWAKPYIDEMAELGYIKGYEDGTFKPNKTISKAEALVLLSRMIGVNDAEYEKASEYALDEYKEKIEKYSAEYEKEVAFLLYRGVIKESELADYISISNRKVELKRYEAAILLTKLLGGEEEVESSAFVSSSYSDTLQIPDSARAYVEYVKEKGIMQGMGNDANGPVFSPNTGVTRSQMAKMLCTLIDALDKSYEEGTVVSTDEIEETVTVKIDGENVVIPVIATTKIKIDGITSTLDELEKNMDVRVSYLNGGASLIENITVIEDAEVYGIVAGVREGTDKTTITIADSENTKITTIYTLSDDASIIVSGAIDTLSKIKTNNYVQLKIKDGLVTRIEVVSKNSSASGFLKALEANSGETYITLEDRNGNTTDYALSSNGVNVSRNNLTSSLSELIIGDTVTIKMTYNKVHSIYAESSMNNSSGVLSYVKHTTGGTWVGIELNGKVTEYKINKSADILVNSQESEVYDLRPGGDIEIKLESSEIIRLETSTTIAAAQMTGTVVSVNPTYGLVIIESNGKEHNIFTNANTKIIDSKTGNGLKLKNLTKDTSVAITGSSASGVYEATVIVIQ